MRFNNFSRRKISDIYFPSPESTFQERGKKEKKKRLFFSPFPFKGKNLIFIVFLISIFGLVYYAFNPKIIIRLFPFKSEFLIEESVKVEPSAKSISLANLSLPGQPLKVELIKGGLYPSSGEKLVEGRAKGIIRVYNNYSTQPQILVARTRFLSPEGRLFRTTKRIVVPGAKYENGKLIPSYTEVEVVAAEPGEEYNIGPTTFSIPGFAGTPKYTGFYGKSLSPMTGGFKKSVKVVTEEDISRAKEDIKKKAFAEAKEKLAKQLPANYKILEGSINQEVVETLSSIKPGMESDSFILKIKVRAKALAISMDDLETLSEKITTKRLAGDRELVPNSLKIKYALLKLDKEKDSAVLKLEINGKSYQKVNKSEILTKLQGQRIDKAEEILYNQGDFQKIEIKETPFWMKRVPTRESQIHLEVILD